jgi:hypothetical protein
LNEQRAHWPHCAQQLRTAASPTTLPYIEDPISFAWFLIQNFSTWILIVCNRNGELPMRLIYMRSTVLLGALAVSGILGGSAFAADSVLQVHCEALATRFKTADMSHMSPDKLEAARRQAAYGEHLCKSAPETGVKALDLAFKDVGLVSN